MELDSIKQLSRKTVSTLQNLKSQHDHSFMLSYSLKKKIAGLKPPLLAIKKQQVEALIRVKRCKGYSKQEKYRKRVIAYFFY